MKSLTYIEIDIDFCALEYGISPCTAAIGVTGERKCFNSIATCQDRANFDNEPVTLRFALPCDYLPKTIDCFPSIREVSFQPATVSLGKNLGQRATLTVTLNDHPHNDRGPGFDKYVTERPYDPWTLGTFFGKFRARQPYLRGRPIRLIRGFLGDPLNTMDTRHYTLESFDGPDPQTGAYTLVAKDVLKFADDDRAKAPVLSNGALAGSIDSDDVSATLNPVGIGNLEYPASGYVCFGGKEVCAFTRVNDVLTLTRAELGTVAQSHTAGDRAQLVLRYDGDDPADIMYDLLVNYANVDPDYISLSEWQAETEQFLSTLYATTITEPTSVRDLVNDLIEQAALAVWWDDQAQLIRLQVLREIATDAATFNADNIIEGSLQTREQPDTRISEIWTWYGQRNPTQTVTDRDNYRATLATVDLQRATDYGSSSVREITARFIQTFNSVQRLNGIQISRYRDPPRRFSFQLFHDQVVQLGGGYRLDWWANQDPTGLQVDCPIQIVRVQVEPDYIRVEAEEMLASGVIVLTQMVFLTTTGSVLQWEVPDSWNYLENNIELIGGGAGGHYNGAAGAGGGGGGAYSRISAQALIPGTLISYRVGAGGPGASGTGPGETAVNGEDTWFGAATFGSALVGARAGVVGLNTGLGGLGGDAASGIGSLRTSGGKGGNGAPRGEGHAGGGGGGGAGGPNGDGAQGGDLFSTNHDAGSGGGGADGGTAGQPEEGSSNIGGLGGNNRFGFGGGSTLSLRNGQQGGGGRGGSSSGSEGGGDDANGGLGGDGEQMWTQTIAPIIAAGPGGGGGGGGAYGPGSNGGLYGGGGGGAGGSTPDAGDGRQGIIVISWREE